MSLDLIMLATILAAGSGMPGMCMARTSPWGERIAAFLMNSAAVAGLTGAALALHAGRQAPATLPWPAVGNSIVGIDALGAFFLAPVFLMGGLGAVYGLGYWPQLHHRDNGQKLRLFWGSLIAGMATVMISRHAMAFLFGWEAMALSAFFLVSTEDHRDECRRAGWIYLVAAHVGTLALFALFALWRHETGSYALEPVAVGVLDAGARTALFFLAFLSFGLKAGMMPLHFWLPGAHASAPSHVSAVLSGVVLKMGIYGLARFLTLIPDPPSAWGALLVAFGAASCLLGVLFAIGQHDLKRLLAYHSVENIGIILLGLGLAMLGRAGGQPAWVALGLGGALLHVWNHSLFKSLLFLSAGSVVHATHTREIDDLGGLARSMPWTAAMFLVGAVAICGLPPLNGFVSELLVYLGLIRTLGGEGQAGSAAVVAVPVLAMAGALALACFVKVYGAVFLGSPRTPACARAEEAPATMKGPMAILAGCCALIGLAPVLVVASLDSVISVWMPDQGPAAPGLASRVPLDTTAAVSVSVVLLSGLLATALARHGRRAARAVTWDCGYALPTARMQYTASSFGQMTLTMFRLVLHPQVHRPVIHGQFPRPASMHSHVDDAVLDRVLLPAARRIARWSAWFHGFQQGLSQQYVLYILVTLLVMLSMQIPVTGIVARLFAN